LAPEEAEASVTGKLSKELAQRLAPHSQLLDAVVNERDSGIILDKLVVPKDQRGGGVGGRFMDDLTAYADESGKPLALTAAGDFGGTKAGQRRFYKRHGFVDNKGRNKDYEFSENMIRPAVVGGAAVASGGTIADEVAEQMDPARTRPGSFLLHGQGMENSMIPNHAGAMLISQGLDAIEDRTVPVLRPFLPTEHLGDVAEDKWAQGRASSALDKFLVWVDTI
jgi:predicted GNAT family N-acyltransferase